MDFRLVGILLPVRRTVYVVRLSGSDARVLNFRLPAKSQSVSFGRHSDAMKIKGASDSQLSVG